VLEYRDQAQHRGLAEPVEGALAPVRAVVKPPVPILKNLFRHKKLRYRGLAKNTAQLCTARGFWGTGLKAKLPEHAVEDAAGNIQPG
jgi:hypothetical protein